MIGLGIFVSWASGASEASQLASAFTTRVVADGGTVESKACLTTDLTYLTNNPVAPDFTGLLNDYSGAAAAYSLRLLDNTYSGNAVRVRRASDNAEQDIGFANNELDTTSLETFCSGTDGFVTTWYDQSGNAVNAANATAAGQPKIVSSGSTITENSKPTIKWVGLNDALTGITSVSISNGLTAIAVNASNSVNTSSADGAILQYNQNIGNHIALGYRNGGYFTRLYKNGVNDLNGYDFASTSLNLVFDYIDYTNVSNEIYVNNVSGSDVNSGRSSTSFVSSLNIGNRIGSNQSPKAAISEMIFYESDQTSNRSGIQTNINTHYSIF